MPGFGPPCKALHFHFPPISAVLLILPTFFSLLWQHLLLSLLDRTCCHHPAPKPLSPKSRKAQWWRIPVECGCRKGTLAFRGSANPTDVLLFQASFAPLVASICFPGFYVNSQATRRGEGGVLPRFYLCLTVLGLQGSCQSNCPASACMGMMLVAQVYIRPQIEAAVSRLFLLSSYIKIQSGSIFMLTVSEERSCIGTFSQGLKHGKKKILRQELI